MYFISLLLAFLTLSLSIMFYGPIWPFLPPTGHVLWLLLLPPLFISGGTYGFSTVKDIFKGIFIKPSPEDARRLETPTRSYGHTCLYLGIIGFVVGCMMAGHNWHDPTKLGPLLTPTVQALFFGLVANGLFFIPLANRYAFIGKENE